MLKNQIYSWLKIWLKSLIEFQNILSKKKIIILFSFIGLFFFVLIFFVVVTIQKENVDIEKFLAKNSQNYLLLDKNEKFVDKIPNHRGLFGYWQIEEVPANIKIAHLGAEDIYFDSHFGVYFPSVLRALYYNFKQGKVSSGASTIAMQVARIVRNKRAKNFIHKFQEMIMAIYFVNKYGKENLLKFYLQMIPYGNRIHGISCAAQIYFNKSVKDLNFSESVFLAAIPKNPNSMNIYSYRGRKNIRDRSQVILKRLKKKKVISKSDYQKYLMEIHAIFPIKKEIRHQSIIHFSHQIVGLLKQNKLKQNKKKLILLPIDIRLQKNISVVCNQLLKQYRRKNVENYSVVIADRKTGGIITYLGSANYFDKQHHGAIDFADIHRSTGSTLKPFIYALGMEKYDFTAATLLPDVNSFFLNNENTFFPENSDHLFFGPVLYRKSLANSRNVSTILLLNKLGHFDTYDFFHKLKIINQKNDLGANYYGLSMATGGIYCSLLDLVSAYGVLANDGKEFELKWIEKWTKNFHQKKKEKKQYLKKEHVQMIANILSDPIARVPTFKRKGSLEYSFPISLKTGTSRGFRDARIMAYDDNYVIGIWLGNADNLSMNNIGGSNSAAYFLREILYILYPYKMNQNNFYDYSKYKIPKHYISKKISAINGTLADNNTSETITEYFAPGLEPKKSISPYKQIFVDVRTDQIVDKQNNKKVPQQFLIKKRVLNLPSYFNSWSSENQIPIHQSIGKEDYKFLQIIESQNVDRKMIKSDLKVQLKIKYPPNKSTLYYDEKNSFQSIGIKPLVNNKNVQQLVWFVNGKENKILDYPNEFRWKIKRGTYDFQFQIPYTDYLSDKVKIFVK